MSQLSGLVWRRCTEADAVVLGGFNAQLAEDEGAESIGPPAAYADRIHGWLSDERYTAAIALRSGSPMGYALWREDPDYGDVFVRQFFVAREHRGAGLGRALFEDAARTFWAGKSLRLDVYDSNPGGAAFWEKVGFRPYSRLMKRSSSPSA